MPTEVAEILIDIEAQLRQLGQWNKVHPPAEALASNLPFCVDTLTLTPVAAICFFADSLRYAAGGSDLARTLWYRANGRGVLPGHWTQKQ